MAIYCEETGKVFIERPGPPPHLQIYLLTRGLPADHPLKQWLRDLAQEFRDSGMEERVQACVDSMSKKT